MTAIVEATKGNILKAARLINQGKIVAFPTETVYGLGANAFNADAVARIFEVKRRPRFDPLIVHIAHFKSLSQVAETVPKEAEALMERFWPGPLTLVLRKNRGLPDLVTSGLPTVAVRMPSHPVAISLISLADTPIAAPSANPFGSLSPTEAAQVAQGLKYGVDLILDGGPCSVGIESTILKLDGGQAYLLRPGGIPLEDLEKAAGRKIYMRASSIIEAPGSSPTHYAPRTPLLLVKPGQFPRELKGRKLGLLAFSEPHHEESFKAVQVLSPSGDLMEAAKNFFTSLFWLDAQGLDFILAEEPPLKGLGLAIMDRLKKGAKRK